MSCLKIDQALTLEDHMEMAKYKGNYFAPELIIPAEVTYAWYLYNPQAFIAARDMETGHIVGHLNYLPFRNEMLIEFLSGKLDASIFSVAYLKQNPNIIRKYDSPGEYYLYLSSVAVAPRYSHTNLLRMMFNAYGEVLLQLAKKEMYIDLLVANAVTQQGIKLGNFFNMQSGVISAPTNNIYISAALTDFLKCMKKSLRTELSAAYKNFHSSTIHHILNSRTKAEVIKL